MYILIIVRFVSISITKKNDHKGFCKKQTIRLRMVSLLVNKLYFVKFSSSTPPSQNVFLPSYILYMYIVYIRHLCTINIIYTHNTYKYIYIYALASCLQASTHTLQLGLARVLQPST